MCRRSSGRRSSTSTRRAASCATAASASARKAWAWAALGVVNRGAVSEITPNMGDHLECDECGMCIDICPVGALTSGMYRYKTRPWEMKHVGTICAHCSNGCKTTLGVFDNQIMRGNNRDRSGINGEFLCVKGRYAFDFVSHPDAAASAAREDRRQVRGGFLVEGAGRGGGEVQRGQGAGRQVRRHRLDPHHQRRELLPPEVRAARDWAPTTSTITAPATWSACWPRSQADRTLWRRPRIFTSGKPFWWWGATWRSSIRCWRSRFAPTGGIISAASTPSRAARCARTPMPSAA